MKPLHGRNVLITGAASGIGYECARSFAQRGATVIIADLNESALAAAQGEIAATGARCIAQCCDVADAASVATLAETVRSAVGGIDVLVNNAGVAYLGAFEETPIAQWHRILDVNVLGVVHCINAFLPAMRAAGVEGRIVNVASVAGVAPAPNMAAYAASKHAVIGLSEVLALELHDTGISVLVVCPGIIDTGIVHVPGTVAPGLSDAQMLKLRTYYHEHGCHPRVVAEAIVRSVESDGKDFLFVGPMAGTARILPRISRRLTRRLTLAGARRSGYL